MKVLFCRIFINYTQESAAKALRDLGCDVVEKQYYTPSDNYHDSRLLQMLGDDIKSGYDVVMTINFWPLVARASHEAGVPYISWSYDCPMNLKSEKDMEYDTNHIFIFDRAECEKYQNMGLRNVHHMPLATDTGLWDKATVAENAPRYDVSFLGSLYESTFPQIYLRLNEHEQGWWNGVIKSQLLIYGYYFADELITEERLNETNKCLEDAGVGSISRRQLSYSLGSYLAYQDRITILGILSKRFNMAFATGKMPENVRKLLPELTVLPEQDYSTKMPLLFKSTKVNINPSLRLIRTGIPQRALDIMGAGGFLLSNYQPELAEFFENGEEAVMYDSVQDAVEKCDYYIRHDDERRRIARNGYIKVKNEFNYEKQLRKMFELAGLHL